MGSVCSVDCSNDLARKARYSVLRSLSYPQPAWESLVVNKAYPVRRSHPTTPAMHPCAVR